MKIAFHSSQLCLRGTEIALYDYAYYNRQLLGNDSIIIAYKHGNMDAYEKFKKEFEVFLYDDYSEVTRIVASENVDAIYSIKAGFNDHKMVPNAKNLVHAVFQYCDPHGDKYAYVSEWLSNNLCGGSVPFVPHMVDIVRFNHNGTLYEELNIPTTATVLGYYGGSDSFNIEFVQKAVIDVALNNKDYYFIFMNVDRFCDLSNVIFMPGSFDMHRKVAFINTCDACLHARMKGESFGLTIAEFSMLNKPSFINSFSVDSAHVHMLGDKAIKYHNFNSVKELILTAKTIKNTKTNWCAYDDYTPEKVMEKFKTVFLT